MVHESLVHKSRVIASTVRAAESLCRELLKDVEGQGFDEDAVFAIHLAMEEAFLNAVKHGNRDDKTKRVHVECRIEPAKFDITIADEGSGFDPDSLPDPRSEENLFRSNGRGVLLMRAYMDVVEFNETGNCVRMIKYKSKPKARG
ncbi:MAG TPA: ATP-binding protein [Anaerohalosphaeraceae bacterium]|jgi:serine/threonine-protein kinase RsbW|nr:ATP-binding protein [Anaerohalosphaeraceae bacterium]HRT51108.1 ATP-binding protein [Anaerohalosphaeraceae bacterium]HRT87123.1 ATP-binding protein [Anaerohalosphaeraceae bacterium]